MAATRIIPPTDDAPFPYEKARAALEGLPGVEVSETDIPSIVATGMQLGWPQSLIDEHWRLLEGGKCRDFAVESGVSCTLWENNIFFRFFDAAHQKRCMPFIEQLAAELGCRLFHH